MRPFARMVSGAAVVALTSLVASAGPVAAVAAAGCTLSKPLFANPYSRGDSSAYAALTTFQHARWAGYVSNGFGDIKVITWRPGRRPTALALRRFRGVEFYERSAVQPVGITPTGAVIANMQDDRSRRSRPFAYPPGRHVELHVLSAWRSVRVLAVTEDGHILGYGNLSNRPMHPRYQLSVWRGIHAAPHVVRTVVGAPYSPPVADRRGDFGWVVDEPTTTLLQARLASGEVRTLDPGFANHGSTLEGGSGPFLFARTAATDTRILRWNTAGAGPTGPLHPQVVAHASGQDRVIAVGAGGAAVFGWSQGLRYSPGAPPSMPVPGAMQTADGPVAAAVGPGGEVAFTRARDHLVHFLTCD
jgi:hypothetical protein